MDTGILVSVISGIGLLLWMILRWKWPAFIALLISSIWVGLLCGLEATTLFQTIQEGMGSTLGFVATIVGLGAMFGAILEHSGGALAIAGFLTSKLGEKKAPLALTLTGFMVAIPVFFDVAFIILIPVIYALQKKTGRSLLLFAIPLLAGLATTHAFIPPTPGPVAVAEILQAELGWVILLGFFTGIPVVLISGLWFGQYIGSRIHISIPDFVKLQDENKEPLQLPPVSLIISIILLPIVLIVTASLVKSGLITITNSIAQQCISIVGHPFTALIIANLVVWYVLGIKRGVNKEKLLDITSRSMGPAGTIILLTGAGGVFKQMLVETGAGEMMASSMTGMGLPVIVFAFVAAVLIRVAQGSATVAMITAAGLTAPLLTFAELSEIKLAALTLAIAAGASALSHVNDSGFWLVKQYLGMDEKQTFKSWSVMTILLAFTGFTMSVIVYYLF